DRQARAARNAEDQGDAAGGPDHLHHAAVARFSAQAPARAGTETAEQRDLRMRNAEIEMAAAPEYDYVVVNEDGKIDRTVKEMTEIVRKEMKKPRHYEL